jgi:hypothetical protein
MSLRLAATWVAAAACGGPGVLEPPELDLACTPQYPPSYAEVFANTLRPDCGVGGCHAGARPRGGLDLSEIDRAYDGLLDGRVIPGDPAHSEAVQRLYTTLRAYQMPPGDPLTDAEKCAVVQWIHGGAHREPPDAGDADASARGRDRMPGP